MPPNNPLSVWGNEKTMNLNPLILTNIQSSPYFKVNLFELKTYHEVIDEIYYKVEHLEPWEKGSRKTAGQTGMCGGVRGVGAGGIVSSAYCLLYKLFTLKLTKKQVIGLITHKDSPYIRGLGFMYIRYTQPPADLWDWYEEYLDDEEEIDVKAGGGHVMTIGEMLRQWLVKLEWYATLFPRIPVPIEKDLAAKLKTRPPILTQPEPEPEHIPDNQVSFGEAERRGGGAGGAGGFRGDSRSRQDREHRSWTPNNYRGSRGPSPAACRPSPYSRRSPARAGGDREDNSFQRELERERERQRRERSRDKERDRDKHRSRSPSRKEKSSHHDRDRKDRERRSRSRDRKESSRHEHRRSRSRDRKHKKDKHRDRNKEKSHHHKSKDRDRERKRSVERDGRW